MDPQAPTQTAATSAQYDSVPATWPGAFNLYKYAKSATLVNWQPYLVVTAIGIVLSGISNQFTKEDTLTTAAIVVSLVSVLVSIFLTVTSTIIELKDVKREKIDFMSSISQSTSYFVKMLLASIVVIALLFGSLLLLIVPFFFVMPRVILFPYYLVDKNLGALDSVKASWEKTKGHVGKVWGIIGVNVLFALLMITIIGIPFALYLLFMYSTASALLYKWIEKNLAPVAAQNAGPIITK